MNDKPSVIICVLLLARLSESSSSEFARFFHNSDSCSSRQYTCRNGQCIPQERLCDGPVDCSDQSDETREVCADIRCINSYVFRCDYGACVDGDVICNGIKDCADNSDENLPSCFVNSTNISEECSPNQFQCADHHQCIDSSSLCDGITDCRDRSDETPLACGSFACDAYVFRCAYGACIDISLRCNGAINCADESDEDPSLCTGSVTHYKTNTSVATTTRTVTQPTVPRVTEKAIHKTAQKFTTKPTQGSMQKRTTSSTPKSAQGFTKPAQNVSTRSAQKPTIKPVQIATHTVTQKSSSLTVTCSIPMQPKNGHYKLYKSHCASGKNCDVNHDVHSLEKGTQLVYSCNSGHKMEGNADVLCGPEGKWLHIPKCIEIRCQGLSSAARDAYCTHNNEHVSCESPVLPFTVAELSCRNSYRRDVSGFKAIAQKDRVTCNATGHWSPSPIECVAECGLLTGSAKTLIVHGSSAKVSEFPWHATLYRQEKSGSNADGEKKFICGASIIRESLLVTAAHCVYNEGTRRPDDHSLFYVVTGNVYRDYETFSPFVKRGKVKNIYIMCTYRGLRGLYANDIAVLELVKPFTLSAVLMPICLDHNSQSGYKTILEPGNIGRVAGFGKTEEGTSSYVLRTISVPYVSQQLCESIASKMDSASYITADKFCAGYTNGSSVCDGDSGGGLVFKSRDLWFLRGIVSVGIGFQGNNADRTCNSYTYSLYTEVARGNLEWLQEVILKLEIEKYYPQCHIESDY